MRYTRDMDIKGIICAAVTTHGIKNSLTSSIFELIYECGQLVVGVYIQRSRNIEHKKYTIEYLVFGGEKISIAPERFFTGAVLVANLAETSGTPFHQSGGSLVQILLSCCSIGPQGALGFPECDSHRHSVIIRYRGSHGSFEEENQCWFLADGIPPRHPFDPCPPLPSVTSCRPRSYWRMHRFLRDRWLFPRSQEKPHLLLLAEKASRFPGQGRCFNPLLPHRSGSCAKGDLFRRQ